MNIERYIKKAFSVTYILLIGAIAFKDIAGFDSVFGECSSWLRVIAQIILYVIITAAIINEVILLIKGLRDENKYWRIISLIRFGLMSIVLGIIVFIELNDLI